MPDNDSPTDWHPADVMAALRKSDAAWTLRRLSIASGYSANAAGEALRRPWFAMEQIIAAALNRSAADIWPSRYNPDGSPKYSRTRQRAA